jgi:anti-sigma B factor antagonist
MSDVTTFELERHPTAEGSAVWVSVSGELDLSVVEQFSRKLEAELSGAPLLLDLAGVTFMDSSALQVVLRVKESLEAAGQPLLMIAPEDSVVASLFELTGLEDSVRRYSTLEEARAALD